MSRKYQTVEPAARKADKCWILEAFKAGISAAKQPLIPRCIYPVFSLLLTSLGPLAVHKVLVTTATMLDSQVFFFKGKKKKKKKKKYGCKNQESIQSSTTPDQGYQC